MIKTRKRKNSRKELLEKEYHLPIARILHYLYWVKQKTWKEIASEFNITQTTVEKWAEESKIESRSLAHQMMFPSKTKEQIETEYKKPLNAVLFHLILERAIRSPEKLEGQGKLPWAIGGNCTVIRHGKTIFKNGKAYGKEGQKWLEYVRIANK